MIIQEDSAKKVFEYRQGRNQSQIQIPETYDLIVWDEYNSLLRHLGSAQMKEKVRITEYMIQMFGMAKKMIISDADFNQRSFDVFINILGNYERKVCFP